MASLSFEAFYRSLGQGEVAPVYYFFGPEDTLKEEAASALLARALDPAWREFNFEQRSAGTLDAEALHVLLNTLPMMAGRRVVFLREVELLRKRPKAREVLLRYLERPSADSVIVLTQTGTATEADRDLTAGAAAVAFEPLPPERVVKWLSRRATEAGVGLEPVAVEHLAVSADYDLATLKAELAKLASLPPGEPLTREQVGALVGVRHGETIYDWRGAVLDGATARALTLLGPVLAQAGATGVRLVTTLGTTLVGVRVARIQLDHGLKGSALFSGVFEALRRARPAGLTDWKEETRRWIEWAPRWPAPRLRAALRATLAADQALKSTRVRDELGVLTDLVLELAPEQREAA
jgi:DNA polymerase-3 subunit delta